MIVELFVNQLFIKSIKMMGNLRNVHFWKNRKRIIRRFSSGFLLRKRNRSDRQKCSANLKFNVSRFENFAKFQAKQKSEFTGWEFCSRWEFCENLETAEFYPKQEKIGQKLCSFWELREIWQEIAKIEFEICRKYVFYRQKSITK